MLGLKQLRLFFEICYGKKISDTTWYNYQKILEKYNFEINTDNLDMLAELRKTTAYLDKALEMITKSGYKNLVAKEITKDELCQVLNKNFPNISRATKYRWFRELGISKVEKISPNKINKFLIKLTAYRQQKGVK